MLTSVKNFLYQFFRTSLKLLKASRVVQSVLYDTRNAAEFSNLFEHEKMLADVVRVTSYRRAIQRYIKPGEVVVDLGTGTGILSFFAAQQKPDKIYAIDHSNFIEVARKIAEYNQIDKVHFVKTNSRNFMAKEKVDVILHEQIGDHLFDENMIENVLDLKHRMLKKSGRILPGKFAIFLEPVSLKDNYRVPFLWENKFDGIDFGFLRRLDDINTYKLADYTMDWLKPSALNFFLCEPKAVLSFDLNKLKDQDDLPKATKITKKVATPGEMNGLCFYFMVIFDDEIYFDTSPVHPNTHWGNRLFRVERKHFGVGDEISYSFNMGDIVDVRTWSVAINHS
jgi:protein arginine N-methyltransferase 1